MSYTQKPPKPATPPATIKQLYPPKWLLAEHLRGQRVTVTIRQVDFDHFYNDRGRKYELKAVLYFVGKKLGLILNPTQARRVADILGETFAAWEGEAITIYPTRARNGKPTIGIDPTKPAPAATEPEPEPEPPWAGPGWTPEKAGVKWDPEARGWVGPKEEGGDHE